MIVIGKGSASLYITDGEERKQDRDLISPESTCTLVTEVTLMRHPVNCGLTCFSLKVPITRGIAHSLNALRSKPTKTETGLYVLLPGLNQMRILTHHGEIPG